MTTISALLALLLGFGRSEARPVAFRSMNAGGPPGAQKKAGNPLIDHGGLVLGSSATHAIYWGKPADFPSDLQSGMAAFLGGCEKTTTTNARENRINIIHIMLTNDLHRNCSLASYNIWIVIRRNISELLYFGETSTFLFSFIEVISV